MVFRVVRVSDAQVRGWWADRTVTKRTCQERCGLHWRTLKDRATALGLPPREDIREPMAWGPLFHEMWMAGVSSREIGVYFSRAASSVSRSAAMAGLPRRAPGPQPHVPMAEFLAARAMKRAASETRVALRLAEMVDHTAGPNPLLAARRAKVADLRAKGATWDDLAAQFGVSATTLRKDYAIGQVAA